MRPILRFTLLAYGITWIGVLPLVTDGLGWTSFGISRLWHAVGAFGPVTAAFVMRRAADRRTRVRDLYARQHAGGLSAGWISLCLASPLLLLFAAWVSAPFTGDAVDAARLFDSVRDPAWLATLFVASVFYGLGEEPGWRGWLLPHLQERRGAVVSTLVLALIWAAWHAPFFAYRYDFDGATTIVGFFVALLAGAFWLTFLYNSTGGSVWTVAVWHLLWNVANLCAAALSMTTVAVLNALMMVLGYGVVLVWGRRGLRAGTDPTE